MPRILLVLLTAVLISACTAAGEPRTSLLVGNGEAAPVAFGHAEYCMAAAARDDARDQQFRAAFCDGSGEREVVELTDDRKRHLDLVQSKVNRAIAYRSTRSWDPLASEGDCKTYAARKELELLALGWPAGALRIATAFVDDEGPHANEYHAVLLVDTNSGTFVLDNRYGSPRRWEDLPYVWISARATRSMTWARLPADERAVSVALAANLVRDSIPNAAIR